MDSSLLFNLATIAYLIAMVLYISFLAFKKEGIGDVYTSVGVMAGLSLIWLGESLFPGVHFDWLDPVAALARSSESAMAKTERVSQVEADHRGITICARTRDHGFLSDGCRCIGADPAAKRGFTGRCCRRRRCPTCRQNIWGR
jgi:hypothetical protein